MNCWEYLKCERIVGGKLAHELGVCPAYTQKSGDGCWLIPNTICKGKIQTDVKNKKAQVCFACDYYASLSIDQKLAMEDKHGYNV